VTVNDCVNGAAARLIRAGFAPDEARRDTAVLARHALGWTMALWAAQARDGAPADLADRLDAAVSRRATREPVAYITGVREFYGREFHVTPAVLIPRPETEGLVERAIEVILDVAGLPAVALAKAGAAGLPAVALAKAGPVIVDVGTGSGCIAITIALECPGARVMATDVSAAALEVARANAERLGARVEIVEVSLLPPEPQAFDVILSNPPYVDRADRASLPRDVRDFEPEGALFADDHGLAVIGALASAARARLTPGGWLLMEIGQGQSASVASRIQAAGLRLERIVPDLQGIPRVVVARQPAAGA
jgi:release factor glutamine methyltransferase